MGTLFGFPTPVSQTVIPGGPAGAHRPVSGIQANDTLITVKHVSGDLATNVDLTSEFAPIAASGTLTGTTIAAGNTVTIDDVTYTFVAALSTGPTVPNEVLVGGDDSESLDNLIAAINGTAGEGTIYSVDTEQPAAGVTAAAGGGDTMDLTADTRGTTGNSIVTTAVLDAGGWGAATLEGGTGATPKAGEIDNTGGTDTTGNFLIVSWKRAE